MEVSEVPAASAIEAAASAIEAAAALAVLLVEAAASVVLLVEAVALVALLVEAVAHTVVAVSALVEEEDKFVTRLALVWLHTPAPSHLEKNLSVWRGFDFRCISVRDPYTMSFPMQSVLPSIQISPPV
jgi:type IV secretory pathway VirB3-like protein